MEKKSLRVKLTLILLAFVLLIMACTVIISNLFLGDYYIYSKQKALIKAFSDINTMYKACLLYTSVVEHLISRCNNPYPGLF